MSAIELTRGDTPVKVYQLLDDALEPLDLVGVTVWFTVKPVIDDDVTDASAVLAFSIGFDNAGAIVDSYGFELGGIDPNPESPTYLQEVDQPVNGVVTLTIPQEDSTAVEPGAYLYDLATRSQTGRYKTIIRNAPFTVVGDITRRITLP